PAGGRNGPPRRPLDCVPGPEMAHVLMRLSRYPYMLISTYLYMWMSGCTRVEGGRSFAELRYPVPVQTLDLGGVRVAYTERGEGEPALLLIHGLASYLPVWSRNLDALARNHRVIAVDLPGYGKSDKANYEYSMGFFARAVERVIEKLELGRVILVGHSM